VCNRHLQGKSGIPQANANPDGYVLSNLRKAVRETKARYDMQAMTFEELRRRLSAASNSAGAIEEHELVELLLADLDAQREAWEQRERDSELLDWLEAHPLATEVVGGADDGATGKAWAIACDARWTLREAIAKAKERPMPNQPEKCPVCETPVEYGAITGSRFPCCVVCGLPVAQWPPIAALVANQRTDAERAVIEAAVAWGNEWLDHPERANSMAASIELQRMGLYAAGCFDAAVELARERRAAEGKARQEETDVRE
jgi:hypothetical protein